MRYVSEVASPYMQKPELYNFTISGIISNPYIGAKAKATKKGEKRLKMKIKEFLYHVGCVKRFTLFKRRFREK